MARSADVDNLDPHLATAFQSREALELIYETLVEFDQDLNVVEGLAEDWEYTDDETLVFHLRDGVEFHDGGALTADDVVATVERLTDPDSGAVAGINFGTIESAEATDDHTVELSLSAADQTLPAAFADANAAIVPEEAIEAETFDDDPNGTGAFEFDEWDPGSVFRLSANDGYWRDGPFVDAVNIRVVPEQSSIAAGLQAGEFDIGVLEDPSIVLTLPEEEVDIHRPDALAYRTLMMNQEREPFDQEEVREAITCAIDREEVLESAALGEGRVTGPFTAPEWQFDPYGGLDCDPPDPDHAMDLLAEAGHEDGFEASAIINSDGYATAVDEGQVLQAQLAEVGIDLELEVLESGVYVDRWIEPDFDVAVALNGGRPDPHNMYARYFGLDGDLNDVATHESEEIDSLIADGLAEDDVEARQDIYREISEQLNADAPWAWLYTGFEYRITQPDVDGFVPFSDGSMRSLRDVSIGQ
ncbi:ABC transporter substrate-binding protein [Egibacter rhizosphaerae]|uniref:ABC transporter substrate-binding protein n=1 Tax=Egibacter rhizosphaerae TaxID=1670831 RepID=A0A411YDA8_9ACTN|nr:ABC transporter substrate-binding protein [Egibacter rhizosphaerae]